MDSSSFKGITQLASKEMDENVAVAELMDLDTFGDSLAVGSWMEDCGDMEFAEMSPNSSASFFNAPFFSLFSFPATENPQLVQDQRLQSNDVKNQEQKAVAHEEHALQSYPVISGIENDTPAARQDPFVRMEGFQVRTELLKSNLTRESDFQQLMDSATRDKSFTRSNDEQNEIRMAPGNNNDDLANNRAEQENDSLLKAIRTYDGSCLLKEKMTRALRYIKAFSGNNVLAQVWVPVKKNGKRVLTTFGQPYSLDYGSDKLINFRSVSLNYEFSTDENSEEGLGIPGRVFVRKLPEWTPDVQYYSSKEYPRVIHAQVYNVRGSLALPVFEPENQTCIGVVELIMTTQRIHYATEFENICKALESVNLRSSEFLDHQKLQIYNESRKAVLPEILEILTAICETHKLPFAQTWAPCRHHKVSTNGDDKKGSCIGIDGCSDGRVCMSTIVEACYRTDPRMFGFQQACSEQHLLKGQGVPGKALQSNQLCFSADVTTFSKMEYPLVHYARMFSLRAAVAIHLRSTLASNDDYVLEFFLPIDCKDLKEQQLMVNSLSTTLQRVRRSLWTVSDRELEEERLIEITDECQTGKNNLKDELLTGEGEKCLIGTPEQEWKRQGSLQQPKQHIQNQIKQPAAKSPTAIEYEVHDSAQVDNGDPTAHSVGEPTSCSSVKENVNMRKRGKVEKNISLAVLRQYFAGSLKDAAKSIGVCPTTLKRICRQHGISRWPSRKISKVNRSIKKLQIVIESVQGVEGAFKLGPYINGSFSPTLSNRWMGNSPLVQGNSCTADMKGETSHLEKRASTEGQEVRSSAQTFPEKCCAVPKELPESQRLMTAGLGTRLPSVLSCKEKPGNHAYPRTFIPENCATPIEGSFMQMTGHYRRGLDSLMDSGLSNSSECSQNSSSSDHCSTEVDPNDQVASYQFGTPQMCQERVQINGQKEQSAFPVVKRVHSEKLLDNRSGKVPVRTSSVNYLDSAPNEARNSIEKGKCIQECSKPSPLHVCFNESSFPMNRNDPESERLISAGRLQTGTLSSAKEFTVMTVKATYKDDTVRFKLSQHMGFQDVREGVAKRFKLELGTFNLRYIDDDSEWVLLTCDADLTECVDIFKSSGGHTIKLLVQDVCPNIGSSCGSTGGL